MKVFIRTLEPQERNKVLWDSEYKRLKLQSYLNRLGFYVLTGLENSLDVYAIKENDNYTIQDLQRILKTLLNLTKF